MAWLEQKAPTSPYRVVFRVGERRVARSLKTKNLRVARAQLARIEETLLLVESGRLPVPPDVDFVAFVMSDGKLTSKATAPKVLTIAQLEKRFLDDLPLGHLEENTLTAMGIHLRHIKRILGSARQINSVGIGELQTYINTRSREPGRRGRNVSAKTIKMELASLRSMWNWGRLHKEIEGPFPNLGLRYPKIDDKPIFRTRAQIERQLGGECLSSDSELWEAMFLYPAETQEVLELARENSRQPFLQPMCAMAAYTGARRSELLRSRLEDIDLDGGVIAIRERKRIKGTKSIRTVPIANALRKILVPWLDAHPGGPWTFGVTRAKPDRLQLTVNQSNHYLEFALRGTKWSVLHGWHTFRHTFVSACACKGIDQRIIDTWVGHQTDAMRRRYRHLFPDVESKAMEQVFAETGN